MVVERRRRERAEKALLNLFMTIMLGWAGWMSLAVIDAKEKIAGIEARLEVLVRANRIPEISNAKVP